MYCRSQLCGGNRPKARMLLPPEGCCNECFHALGRVCTQENSQSKLNARSCLHVMDIHSSQLTQQAPHKGLASFRICMCKRVTHTIYTCMQVTVWGGGLLRGGGLLHGGSAAGDRAQHQCLPDIGCSQGCLQLHCRCFPHRRPHCVD